MKILMEVEIPTVNAPENPVDWNSGIAMSWAQGVIDDCNLTKAVWNQYELLSAEITG